MLHTHEVTGSSPVAPTTHNLRARRGFQLQQTVERHARHAVYRRVYVRFGAFCLLPCRVSCVKLFSGPRMQAGAGPGSRVYGAEWSAIKKPVAADLRRCSIGAFGNANRKSQSQRGGTMSSRWQMSLSTLVIGGTAFFVGPMLWPMSPSVPAPPSSLLPG